jgi:5-methylcytosine-specific restriction endonuclease McrA
MATIYRKYDPGTYHSRDLYRIVCETNDLRPVWAYKNANKWSVEYKQFLKLCGIECSCCKSLLDYGLGKNNTKDKSDVNTPSTDHIVAQDTAKKLGWTNEQINDISNLWIICMRCNLLKNNSTAEDIHRYKAIVEVLEKTKSILTENT